MLNKTQIKKSIDWLLKNASDPVKYLTYKNILKEEVAITNKLRSNIEQSAIVKDISSKQEIDGSWCSHGAWASKAVMRKSGYTPVSPKYVTTAWILPILGDLGYDLMDERIQKAIEYVLSYQMDNGFIGETKPTNLKPGIDLSKNEPCRFSIILTGLGKVGAIENLKVKKAFNLLTSWQRDDGGWVSESHSQNKEWNRSCPFASCHSAMALYSIGVNIYKTQLRNALEFLLKHLSTKKEGEIQRFFYNGHSIIHELLMFADLKVGIDSKVVESLLDWLLSMYQSSEYHFKHKGKALSKYTLKDDYMDSRVAKYRLFQLAEDDWLTYYAIRIFKNIN